MRPLVGTIFKLWRYQLDPMIPIPCTIVCEDNISYKFIYPIYKIHFSLLTLRHDKMGGSDRVNRVMGQTGHGSKTGHFKRVKNGFRLIGLRVRSGWPVFFTWIFFYKENNMYLPFKKLCNKLFDVKCIILNSPLILRMNSVKLINTYSIILKLYKS